MKIVATKHQFVIRCFIFFLIGMLRVTICNRANAATEPFSFILTADTRQYAGSGQYDTIEYFRGACQAISRIGEGAFMISPGDIDPPHQIRWTIDQYLGKDYIWYPVVGNHEAETSEDMFWIRNVKPDLPYIVNSGPTGTSQTTYSFDYQNAHFVVINQYYDGEMDTRADGYVVDRLYDWLKKDLETTTKPYIFVIGHEPAFPKPDAENGRLRHEDDSLNKYPANRDRFWNLLSTKGVLAYLCGHTHNFSLAKIQDVWQLDVGHARGVGDVGAPSTFCKIDVSESDVILHVYRDTHDGQYDYDDIVITKNLVSNFKVDITQISNPEYYVDTTSPDDYVYSDRPYKISTLPSKLNGATRIVTANNDKYQTGDNFLSFHSNRDVTVLVAYDNSIPFTPDWLKPWYKTRLTIESEDSKYTCFAKEFSAGSITLGGNAGNDQSSMYLIFIGDFTALPQYLPDPEFLFIGDLENQTIHESSGFATSQLNKNVLWTLNDSGNKASVFAVGTDGTDLGELKIQNATNIDWEDMASFMLQNKAYLLIADVGDNRRARSHCDIYFIQEPSLLNGSLPEGSTTPIAWKISFIYEDGPQNCEAIAVDAEAEKIYLVGKSNTSPPLYELPLVTENANKVANKISHVVNTPYPTAMDISVEHSAAVILTSNSLYFYERQPSQTWEQTFSQPKNIFQLPPMRQPESVCFDLLGRDIYVTSEQLPSPLYVMHIYYPITDVTPPVPPKGLSVTELDN